MNNNDSFEKWFSKKLETSKTQPGYILESVLYKVTELIEEEMDKQKVSRSELARRINKAPSLVSRFLNCTRNITFSTAVQIGAALGMRLTVGFEPLSDSRDANLDAFDPECISRIYWNKESMDLMNDCMERVKSEDISNDYRPASDLEEYPLAA